MNSKSFPSGGTTYERWGRNDCPGDAQLVYPGFIGGGWFDEYGNGNQYVCLPFDPEYVDMHEIKPGYKSWIYSTEYRTNDEVFGKQTHYFDAPCAVCHVPRSTKIMIPAKVSCPDSFTLEYSGYMMSAAYTNKNSKDYACVDQNADTMLSSNEDTKGALLYFVSANKDNSFLPCPPYVHGIPITCAVCTV